MAYNTGKPVPSRDPRDLIDNAESFDIRATSRDVRSTPDRLGVSRKTWYGMEQDFAEFLARSGFEPVHLIYQDGVALQVDRPTQLIDYSGSVYRVKMPASFPVMLSGTWATDSALLVQSQDQSLRDELQDPDAESAGAALLGRATVAVDSVRALLKAKRDASQAVLVKSYHDGWSAANTTPTGGGIFVWMPGRPKAQHNGGSVISPTVPWDGAQSGLSAFLEGVGETEPAGSGCWVRLMDGPAHTSYFGARYDDETDDYAAIQKAVISHRSVYHGGMSRISQTVTQELERWEFKGTSGVSGLRVTGAFGALAPTATFYGSKGEVSGITFTSSSPGVGYGLLGGEDLYFAWWHIHDCSFEKRLRGGIFANLISCMIENNDFGVYGNNADQPHQAMRIAGQPWLTASALTTNFNTIRKNWILNSKLVNHAIEAINGMDVKIYDNQIEKCTPGISAVHLMGCRNPKIHDNWFEDSHGTTFIKCDLDPETAAVDQRTLSVRGNIFSPSPTRPAPASIVQFTGPNMNLAFCDNVGLNITFPVASGGARFTKRANNDFVGTESFVRGFRVGDPAYFWAPSGSSAYAGGSLAAGARTNSIVIAAPGAEVGDLVVSAYSEDLAGGCVYAYVDVPGSIRAFIANPGGSAITVPAGTIRAVARPFS